MMKKVFVIEDDPNVSEVIHLILKQHFCLKIIHSTHNAFSEIKKFEPDLLLLDHWVGETKLAELVSCLREDRRFRHIPVIVSSTNDSVISILDRLQADAYLLKPFDLDEFLLLIKDQLKARN